MSAGVTEKLFTVEEYHRMAEAGILRPGDRMELIEGKIIQMSAIGHRHFVSVMRAHTFLMETLERRILLSIQGPIRLSDWTEPEPDLVIFKPRADFYAQKRPTPADVFFIVEVSDTSLTYDQRIKLPRFAAAGIPEVWIEDLQNKLLLVHRDPAGDVYKTTMTLRAEDSISPLAFPDAVFRVEDLLGPDVGPE